MSTRHVRSITPAVALTRTLVTRAMTGVFLALLAMHALSQVARFAFGRPTVLGLTGRVYLGAEASLPAWFSSTLMLMAAGLLLWIGAAARHAGRVQARYWGALGALFVLLSADETAALHEAAAPAFTGAVTWLAREVGGVFVGLQEKRGYHWVIPGSVFVVVLGVALTRFLISLPAATRRRFVLAGAIYVSGALGFEVLGGDYSGRVGPDTVTFVTLMTIEESLEIVGLIVFVSALLAHIEEAYGGIRVSLGGPDVAGTPGPASG